MYYNFNILAADYEITVFYKMYYTSSIDIYPRGGFAKKNVVYVYIMGINSLVPWSVFLPHDRQDGHSCKHLASEREAFERECAGEHISDRERRRAIRRRKCPSGFNTRGALTLHHTFLQYNAAYSKDRKAAAAAEVTTSVQLSTIRSCYLSCNR